jgi:hypothetical protein
MLVQLFRHQFYIADHKTMEIFLKTDKYCQKMTTFTSAIMRLNRNFFPAISRKPYNPIASLRPGMSLTAFL